MNSPSLGIFFLVWAIFSPFFSSFFLTRLVGMWHTFFGYASFLSFFFDMPCGHVAYLLWVCIFYFFSLFLTCLVGMWHTFFGYASFISFCIAHTFDDNFGESESWYDMEFYFMGGWQCLLSSSVEV